MILIIDRFVWEYLIISDLIKTLIINYIFDSIESVRHKYDGICFNMKKKWIFIKLTKIVWIERFVYDDEKEYIRLLIEEKKEKQKKFFFLVLFSWNKDLLSSSLFQIK